LNRLEALLANMLVEDHLRPAATAAGVLKEGERVRFGFHNLRHSLASFLVRSKTDPKTVQALLRHSDVKTTLQLPVIVFSFCATEEHFTPHPCQSVHSTFITSALTGRCQNNDWELA
jgi:site-specific recombinase XerD